MQLARNCKESEASINTDGNESKTKQLNNSTVFYVEQFKYLNNMELYDVLKLVTVNNWFCGKVSLLFAWSNGCTIESKTDQDKVRRILLKNGYKAHFKNCVLKKISLLSK